MRPFILTILLLPTLALASNRRTVIISDSHLGVGRTDATHWHPYEDFQWGGDFAAFLRQLRADGRGATDLVLNGDSFELWQSVKNPKCDREDLADCRYDNEDLSCTEAEALDRMTRVVTQHADTLKNLKAFANDGDNRIYIVPGNHDAALLFPRVASLLIKKIGAKKNRVHVMTGGYWLSADGFILAAHGHQMDDTNRYERWPNVFRMEQGKQHLERPWGEQFVQAFYNGIECKYPIIDNIAGEANAIRYGLAAEGKLRSIKHAGRFAKFFLFSVSARQMGDVLATPPTEKQEQSTEWDITAIRQSGPEFFVESVPRDDLARASIEEAAKAGAFDHAIEELLPEDINAICNERAALRDSRVDIERCPTATLNALAHALTTETDERIMRYLHDVYDSLPSAPKARPAFQVAVFSHTHAAVDAFIPKVQGELWKPFVLNTGAWQRIIRADVLDKLRKDRNLKPADVLKSLHLKDLPACYPFVVIEPYKTRAAGKLHYWKQNGGKWVVREACAE